MLLDPPHPFYRTGYEQRPMFGAPRQPMEWPTIIILKYGYLLVTQTLFGREFCVSFQLLMFSLELKSNDSSPDPLLFYPAPSSFSTALGVNPGKNRPSSRAAEPGEGDCI